MTEESLSVSTKVLDACETQSVEEIRDQSLVSLQGALKRAVVASPFWASRFAEIGVNPGEIRCVEEFERLPLLDKKTILADQADNGPFGKLLAVRQDQLQRIHRTSGTTATPLLVLLTRKDVRNAVKVGGRAFRCAGVEPSDIVIHCLNYCMWSGGVTDHEALEEAGATVVPFGVGNSSFLLQMIQRLRPTALSCTPSYLVRLRQLLADEFNKKPSDLKLTKAFLGGEGGLQDPAVRSSFEAEWNIRAIDANYGLSDVLSIMASECEARDGLHFHAQDMVFPELIDDKDKAIGIAAGAVGELVLSNLVREAQPLFRYRTNDVVEIVATEPCMCGRHGFRFKVIGRSDDMVTVKGVNFFPSSLQGMFNKYTELSGEYRVRAPRPPIQSLHLELEKASAGIQANWSGLAGEIADLVSAQFFIKVDVEFRGHGEFPKTDDKTRRLIRD
jgi:phenylacetate-CoA ligase